MAKKGKSRRTTRNNTARRSLRFSPIARRSVPASTIPRVRRVRKAPPQRTGRIVVGLQQQPRSTKTKRAHAALLTKQTKKDIMVCRRRQQRKEIIHAVGKSGQSGQKKPDLKTRNIKC
jgi:hypothetical protein